MPVRHIGALAPLLLLKHAAESGKKKYLYMFEEGNKDMRELLGGKGANLAEMTNAGMPVPPGFTIQQGALHIAKLLANLLFQLLQVYKDVSHDILIDLAAIGL